MARCVVTGLREALAGDLDLRRGLGFKLERDAKLLAQFIAYLEQRGAATLTVADALAWATLPAGASPGWLRMRITVVRGFAAYLATVDPSAECRATARGAASVLTRPLT
jgi:integrase/recombinase XerD